MGFGVTNSVISNDYAVKNNEPSKTENQREESFADFFQKGNVKHLEGAKYAMAPNGDELKNTYFRGAKDGMVSYNGVTFRCNYKTGALELGDCSHPNQCIRVALEKGGSLLFNPDSISGINQAIGMFSAEDQGRIMRAIQLYNMSKDKLEELEEEENADPEDRSLGKVDSNEGDNDQRETTPEEVNQADATKDYVATLRERTEVYEIYDVA